MRGVRHMFREDGTGMVTGIGVKITEASDDGGNVLGIKDGDIIRLDTPLIPDGEPDSRNPLLNIFADGVLIARGIETIGGHLDDDGAWHDNGTFRISVRELVPATREIGVSQIVNE